MSEIDLTQNFEVSVPNCNEPGYEIPVHPLFGSADMDRTVQPDDEPKRQVSDSDAEREFFSPTGFQGVDGLKPRFQVVEGGFIQNRDGLFPDATLEGYRKAVNDDFAAPRILRIVNSNQS